ncbi:MAG: Si-specific NAD(P)(+) transhydrogenase [Myxococcota bacterium]
MQRYDVVVIGSGPGGEAAAMTAAKGGERVALVDRQSDIGGGCVHWGTIPSKMLRRTVQQYTTMRNSELFGPALKNYPIEYQDLIKQAESVIHKQVRMRTRFYDRNDVDVYDGHGAFVDAHTLDVTSPEGSKRVQADRFIIAVGSRPYRPTDIDFTHPRIRDSDTILQMDETPGTITIYGAGVIGCEYASIFRNLDCKVNLLNTRDKLLSFLDDEIIDALAYHLREQGALIRHNEAYERVVATEDRVELHMQSGKIIRSDVLLWAQGRSGQTEGLGLERVGIEVNSRKQIDVDENYQTSMANIYAVGDVIGQPGLASASYDQGRFAATHSIFGVCDKRLVEHIPTGIYTSPEISSVGPTERALTEQCVPYEVGHALFRSLARAQIVDNRVGMLKLLFHRETHEILGIHCFGYQAAEIVHIGQAIMAQTGPGNDIRYFANTTFNYPTMAEAYRVAALNGLNRLR